MPGIYFLSDIGAPIPTDGSGFPEPASQALVTYKFSFPTQDFELFTGYLTGEIEPGLRLRRKSRATSHGRLFLRFLDGRRDDGAAQVIFDALVALEGAIFDGTFQEDPVLLWCPASSMKRGHVSIQTLLRSLGATPRTVDSFALSALRKRIAFCTRRTEVDFLRLLEFLPSATDNPCWLAAHFLLLSVDDFRARDHLHVAQHDAAAAPLTGIARARLETAFLNGFKTIEALVGEPGRSIARDKVDRQVLNFRQRVLTLTGIDAAIAFTLPIKDGRSLERLIVDLQTIRDTRCAHGSASIARRITYREACTAQWVAFALLSAALVQKSDLSKKPIVKVTMAQV